MSKFLTKISEMNTIKYLMYLLLISILYLIFLISFELIFQSDNNNNENYSTNKKIETANTVKDSAITIEIQDDNDDIKIEDDDKKTKKIIKKKGATFESLFYNEKEEEEFERVEKIKADKIRQKKLALAKKNKKPEFATPDFIKKKKIAEKKKKTIVPKDTIPYNRTKNITYNIIQTKRKSIKKCIKRSRVKFKDLTGVIDFQLSIDNTGKILNIVIISSKWNSKKYGKKTEQCMMKTMKYWKFPIVRNKEPYKIISKFVF